MKFELFSGGWECIISTGVELLKALTGSLGSVRKLSQISREINKNHFVEGNGKFKSLSEDYKL